jgi:hypothetical protein
MKNLTLILLIGLVIFFSSCRKNFNEDIIPADPITMEKLLVPSDFNWKTTKEYTVVMTTTTNGLVEVSNKDGVPYQKAFLVSDKTFTMNLTLPSFEKKIYVKHGSQNKEIELTAVQLNVNF